MVFAWPVCLIRVDTMYAELHVKSHYTFLTGASSPDELVYKAAELGYSAIAITDECSYSGIVKAYQASRECNIKLIIGSEFNIDTQHGKLKLLLLAPSRTAYAEISALISKSRRRTAKGSYATGIEDLQFGLQHCLAIWLPSFNQYDTHHGLALTRLFKHRLWIGVELFRQSNDQQGYLHCEQLSRTLNLNMVACNDVHMHCKSRKPLQDTVTAIRHGCTVEQLQNQRQLNAERYLKPIDVLQQQYPRSLLEETLQISDLCDFSMNQLRYQYPREVVPSGQTATSYLRQLSIAGARRRFPEGVPKKVIRAIRYELKIIRQLHYEYYFLTIYDIVKFARTLGILCQGRGSAANSSVCYCLYVTEVNPDENELLFERFISKERDEPPDIDVDFESDRREEVIQYIYTKYTRKRTALLATVITYRRKSAIRDVGKALGLPLNLIEDLNRSMAWWDKLDVLEQHMQQRQFNINSHLGRYFFSLVKQILGTPRHLSQHVGGFLITEAPTSTLVPIENASMANRTVIQWDKFDIQILGLIKVDILGLGMLSAIKRALDMINGAVPTSKPMTIHDIPHDDPKVYELLCKADTIGVFQVESRAQMTMLPRLKPRCFYDLVIEVAIVRPGPIQGDMVHPYLRRRNGEDPVEYANPQIKAVLQRTLGIPIFQEQVIKLTMVAAGFSGGEADQLRRAMASWGKRGDIEQFRDKLVRGMLQRGYTQQFAEQIFNQINGFGSYGFPESHSASFAILVYLSSWLKLYHPIAFYAGILNSQPMGFYTPSQLIQDAKRHNIVVLPICINSSDWQHKLEYLNAMPALRLGICLIKGIRQSSAIAAVNARQKKRFKSISDVKQRQLFNSNEILKMVDADAFHRFEENRRRVYWHSIQNDDGLNTQKPGQADFIPELTSLDTLLLDYQHARGVSLKYHPMQLLRNTHPFQRCTTAENIFAQTNNSMIEVSGVVTCRQRPGTASGVIFMTLEDETGNLNIVLWNSIQARFREAILSGHILYIKGKLEHQQGVANIIAGYIEKHDHALSNLKTHSRNFH
ncbi:MAG: error-prone DNA polymerase [Arenicella sp.]|jgi:error-prone DNA polymerase